MNKNIGVFRNKKWNKVRYTICACLLLASIWGITGCRNEESPSKPKIEKLTFAEKKKTIYAGDTVTIAINAEPKEAKKYDKITYKATEKDIIEIKAESGNDGVVIAGLKRGNTVITASANSVRDYCEITVLGGDNSEIPHILVENYVFECRENEKRTITATLAGGTPLDNSAFMWTYSDQNVINLETADNVAVFDTLKTGSSVITASHPKAQYSVDILVYVLGNDEIPVYITTEYNIIKLQATQSNYQFSVALNGGGESDFYNFNMQVTDGTDIISLVSNNNIGTINPLKKGTAKIRVGHPKAQYSLDIVVIVYEEIEYKYIDLNKTLIIMEENEEDLIIANFAGNVPQDFNEKYKYEIEDTSVIDVVQSYNNFAIKGLKRGKSIIKIKNEYADFDKEALVIVNGIASIYDREIYINTNQNVISTEVGADDVLLTMTLVGGNEADRNNFVWTVDDGTVIEVTSAHGRVNYTNRMISNVDDKFEAQALIKAKKVGTAKITLENPKAKNSFSVLVKVYKKGVFEVIPAVLSGPSLYTVDIGQKYTARLRVAAGNERNLNDLSWASGDNGILDVAGTGLIGVLEGKNYGITKITVEGGNLKYPYEATVIVGDENYFKSIPYIYVLNPYISVAKGGSVYFGIQCENLTKEQLENIEIINNDKNIIETFGYRKNVTVTGLEPGEGELIIRSPGLDDVCVKVRVEEHAVNPDKPFYLRSGKEIYGVVKGQTLNVSVDLVGAAAHNEKNLIWSIENPSIASITENGKSCIVRGLIAGQTLITVKHAKSINPELNIVIYVVETSDELTSKIILYMKQTTVLMDLGEARYISVVTNADDTRKKALSWDITGDNVIDYKVSEDRVKAYVYAKSAGSAVIRVSSANVMVPAVVYISVINRNVMQKYIDVPSILELVMGQAVTVNAVTENVNASIITWTAKNNDIINVYGNGPSCLVNPAGSGNTVLTVEHIGEKYKKDILVYVYGSITEMQESYILASEQTRYVINKGDIISVNLVFGMRGYPEHEIINIGWSSGENNVVGVEGNGRTAKVTGKNPGVGTVIVAGKCNTIQIEIEVRDDAYKAGGYWFKIKPEDKVKGMLAGSTAAIEAEVWNGNSRVYNINKIEFENENDGIVSVELNGLVLTVRAAAGKEGQSYITLKHNAVEDTRILIYTAMTDFGLQNAYPLFIEKSNYLMQKGQVVDIAVQTTDNNASKYNNINYSLQHNNGIIRIAEKDKRTVTVEALKIGSDVILIRYNTEIVQRVYVSVTESGYTLNAGYLVTENIIALLAGTEYETEVNTNYSGIINWTSDNIYITSIGRREGKKAVIKAENPGQVMVTVKTGDLTGYLKVIVCATPEELQSCKAINIDQRYYRIRKNESVNINVHSYNGAVEGATVYADNYNYSPAFGGVLKINSAENHKLSVTGVQEGVAAIKVSNSFYGETFVVYVEVSNSGNGSVNDIENQCYITAAKTMYVVGLQEHDIIINVMVAGSGFRGDTYWTWRVEKNDIINLEYIGAMAVINPVKEGETKIIVENPFCQNSPFEILVVVGERYETDNSRLPYIHLEKDVYEAVRGGGNIVIPYSLINIENIDTANFAVSNYNTDVVTYRNDIGKKELTIEPVKTGIARLIIWYKDLKRELYVLVKENINAQSVYLTTSENYVIMSEGEFRTIKTKLVGTDDVNANNFKWKVEPEYGVVQVFGNGETGQIYALAASNTVAKVTVTYNPVPDFPLTVYVRVVKDKTQVNMAYLTTQQNVIEMVAGSASETVNIQKIGNLGADDKIIWADYDSQIINVEPHGEYAGITPKKEGITKIKVYIEGNSSVKLDIVVLVKPSLGNDIYIEVNETLIMMKPHESSKRITASLINGDSKDNNRFRWEKYGQDIVNPAAALSGGNVISILANNEECVINALYEGIARIKITNERAERSLIITVYVTQYESISFENSIRNMLCGEVSIVSLNLPTYENMANRVVVQSSDTAGNLVEIYNTNTTVFLKANDKGNEGAVKLTAYIRGQEYKIAEMAVNIKKEDPPYANKIVVDTQILNCSLKDKNYSINANITGPDITEGAKNSIEWVVQQSVYGDYEKVIDVLPATNTGRQIQITIKGLGEATITVKHTELVEEGYWKTIKIIVSDLGNNFSLSPDTKTVIKNRQPFPVEAEIVGGTTRDYSEIKWIVMPQQRWDGTMLEVVRVMGSGKQVLLYPMNDGVTKLIAYYGKEIKELDIVVENEYYFDFKTGTEYMFPDETREIEYEIRPASSNVNWVRSGLTDPANASQGPVVIFSDIMGSATVQNNTSIRKLFIEAKREGTDSIVGMANGHVAQLQIVVNYNYSCRIGKENRALDNSIPQPQYPGISDGSSQVDYWIWPPNTYIELDRTTPLSAGLSINIVPPDEEGHGYIKYISTLEVAHINKGVGDDTRLKFNHFKNKKPGTSTGVLITDEEYGNNANEKATSVKYIFRNVEPLFDFVIGDGKWSYLDGNKGNNWKKEGNTYTYNGTVHIGDGEQHYIVIQPNITTAQMEIDNGDIREFPETKYPSPDTDEKYSSKLSAKKAEIYTNGAKQTAIGLSGGIDYIVYDRVMFDKNLVLSITADKSYIGESNSGLDVSKEPLYTNFYVIKQINRVYQYIVPWTSLDNPPTHKYGTPTFEASDYPDEAEYRYYYLISNEILPTIMQMEGYSGIEGWGRNIGDTSLDQWLYNYDSEIYPYYFYADYCPPLDAYCAKIKVYRPAAYYDWTIYVQRLSEFYEGTNTEHLIYDQNHNIVGGHVYSYSLLSGEWGYVDEDLNNDIVIYSYNKSEVDEIAIDPDNNYDDDYIARAKEVFFPSGRFRIGMFAQSMIPNIQGYDATKYYYSSNLYEIDVVKEISPTGNVTTKYNLLTQKSEVINGQHGVFIRTKEPGILKPVDNNPEKLREKYNRNILVFKHYDPYKNVTNPQDSRKRYETFYYENLKIMPVSDSLGGVPTDSGGGNSPPWQPKTHNGNGLCILWGQGEDDDNINMHRSNSATKKYLYTITETIGTPSGPIIKEKKVYDKLKDVASNSIGINIFGRNTDVTGDARIIVYGRYSNTYRMGRPFEKHYYTENNGYYTYYSQAGAQNRLDWEEIAGDNKPIIPYYYWNQYPFRFQKSTGNTITSGKYKNYNDDYNLIKLNEGGGKPMPSVDTSLLFEKKVNIELRFKKFSVSDNETVITVIIPVVYEVRQCHMNYMGHNEFLYNPSKYSNILGNIHVNNELANGGFVTEYVGMHSSFTELGKFTKDMNPEDDRKKIYEAMNVFCQ
jgi:hypothetical protein